MEQITVRPLGVRGAAPNSGEKFKRYGGATACVLVQAGGENIIFDAGTGLLSVREYLKREERSVHILLSHPHLDHLQGLPVCPLCFEADTGLRLYAVPRGGLSALRQVEALLSPPLWPVGVDAFTAKVTFRDIMTPAFFIGDVRVESTEGSHKGGCTLFRLTYEGKSIVYATDFEQDMGADDRLCEFARGCDLLLCDGEYRQEELLGKRGFGHSSWSFAAETGRRCGARQTKIIHHALYRTDEELDKAQESIAASSPGCSFAKAGEEIIL